MLDELNIISTLLEDYSGILSLVSILVAIFTFFFQQHREKKIKQKELNEKISLYCKSVLKNITDIKELKEIIIWKELIRNNQSIILS